MESSPPPNLANLNQFFNQYDTDQDGKVNDQQIHKIFQDIGFTDVYIGTIRKVIRLMNVVNPDELCLNFPQVEEFAEAMVTKGKFKVWKAKLSINEELKIVLKQIYGEQESAAGGAGPGAAPSSAPAPSNGKISDNQQGEISVNVGITPVSTQYINANLEKQTGQQIKPFVKISVERNNNEEAKKIETLFKSMYDTVIEILKAEQEELISEILSVSFITSVTNNVFNLFITTPNQSLIELAEIFVNYLDSLIKTPINGKIQSSFKFDFDFNKFVSDPSFNFYDIFVKNSSFHLKWNLWELFGSLRKFALAAKAFQDLEWDQSDEFCMFFLLLLHSERLVGKFQFNNTSSENQETKSKDELTQVLSEIRNSLTSFGEETGLPLIEMLNQLDGKITVEVGVRDWRLNVEAKLKNFVKIFTEKIEGEQSDDQVSYQAPVGFEESSGLQKQSSLKSLKAKSDSGSECSKKKPPKKVQAKEGSAAQKGMETTNNAELSEGSSCPPDSD